MDKSTFRCPDGTEVIWLITSDPYNNTGDCCQQAAHPLFADKLNLC